MKPKNLEIPTASAMKAACPLWIAAALAFVSWPGHVHAASTLIDKTFDGNNANDTGPAFQGFSNGTGTGGAGDPATGIISTGNNVNSTRGLNIVSLVTVPAGTTSLTATFVVTSAPTAVSGLAANGLFFGIVSGASAATTGSDAIYVNATRAFGYVAGSSNPAGDHAVVQDLNATTPTVAFSLPSVPSNASFEDGFTVSVTISSNDTWSITTTGLSANADGTGGYAGSLNTVAASGGFDFATFIAGGVGLNSSLQSNTQSVSISQMTLTAIPEPSSGLMAGICAMGMLCVRRRGSS